MSETKLTRVLCNGLKAMNAKVFAIVASKMQEPGWPDRFIAHRYWRGWIEFKGPRTRSTTKQRIIIRELNERGENACFVRFPNRIENWKHDLMGTWDGTPRGLILTLRELFMDSCPHCKSKNLEIAQVGDEYAVMCLDCRALGPMAPSEFEADEYFTNGPPRV